MSRAVRATPDQVVVTAGAQGALATAARLWLGGRARRWPSRIPASPHLRRTFEALGVPLIHVPVDDRGLLVDRLPDGPAAVHGDAVVAVPERRHDARRAADAAARLGRPQRGGGHRGRLRQRAALRGPPAAVAPGPRRAGTRALRRARSARSCTRGCGTGYAVVPRRSVEVFVARHEAGYRGPGALEQRALALFLAEGHFERHLVRVRAHYAERQAALLATLAAELGTVVSARPAAAGPTWSCGSRTCS